MKTTIELPDELFQLLKERATKTKVPIREVLEHSLRQYLELQDMELGYILPDLSYGKGGLRSGVDLSNWNDIRSLVYEEI